MTIMLNGSDLTVTQVVAAARRGEAVALAPVSLEAMRQARVVVQGPCRPGHFRRCHYSADELRSLQRVASEGSTLPSIGYRSNLDALAGRGR